MPWKRTFENPLCWQASLCVGGGGEEGGSYKEVSVLGVHASSSAQLQVTHGLNHRGELFPKHKSYLVFLVV